MFFSGIFIISILCIGHYIYINIIKKEYEKLFLLIGFIAISIFLVIITDGSWWARYVPYIYLFPILALFLTAKKNKKIHSLVTSIICILLLVNIGIISYTSIKNCIENYIRINNDFNNMKRITAYEGKVVIALREGGFNSLLYNFKDKNISVEIKEKEKLINPKYVNQFYYDNLEIKNKYIFK